MSEEDSGHSRMFSKRNGTALTKTGFTSPSMEIPATTMAYGMKAGRGTLIS